MKKENNLAFIDGQNLYYSTKENKWKIDYRKLRTYLKDKYHISEAYYFFGYIDEDQQPLYSNLQKAGFIVTFREHISSLKGTKKGNVDTDIVFEVMKALIERSDFDKILLISGDGDYKKMVDYLIERGKFKKILFPDINTASSLYKSISRLYFDHLDKATLQNKIGYTYKKKRGP
ncbi:NYN domain-containing protein [Patescibacteria group bacterium]|nr:NYN domain-containing protein [Patescibacteria group bacterium]